LKRLLSSLQLIPILAFASLLAGCKVGPDFKTPEGPATQTYLPQPSIKQTVATPAAGAAGKSQVFNYGEDIPAEWWRLFHSKVINSLVEQGLANSPNLAAAKATLRQAQETLRAQMGTSYYPAISANLAVQRQEFSNATFGDSGSTLFDLYNTSVSVAYPVDVFGLQRRQVESTAAQMDYQRFELQAAYISLTANIVTSAISIASLNAQLQATQALVKEEEQQLNIIKKQLNLGGVSGTNVLTQEAQVAQTRALLPPIEQSLAQAQHSLAVLVGQFPGNMQIPILDLNSLRLPTRIPVSIPSSLVQQRPDIRAAEAQLHTASAQVGVATANLYPQITLNAALGWSALSTADYFSNQNRNWNIGPQLVQPLFQGGSLRATRSASIAAYEASFAQYKQTVLQAFQNVADTLTALENDAKALQAQSAAETAARNTMRITEKQLALGGVSYLNLLTAQQQYQQARINRIKAEATRYADTAALFQALGGGWWNRGKIILPSPDLSR